MTPDLGHETDEDSGGDGAGPVAAGGGPLPFIRCRVCSTPNESGRRYCVGCRGPRDRSPAITADEAAALVQRRQRGKKLRRWRMLGIVAACLVVVGIVVYLRLRPPDPLPRPASTVTASSQPGEFTQAGYDALNSNHAPDVPSFTGEVRWTFRTAEPFTAAPAALGDTVYAATGDGRIVALDAETGGLRWEFKTGGPVDSSPAVAGDWLFVGLRDGRFLSLERTTGTMRWSFDTGRAVNAAPLVVDGEVYVANASGVLTVLDAVTGAVRWQTGEDRAEGPVTRVGNVIYTTAETKYYTWDANTGTAIHQYSASASVSTPVLVAGELAYAGDFGGSVWATDVDYRPEWYTKGPGRRWLNQLYLWDMAPRPPDGLRWGKRLGRDILYPFATDGQTLFIPDGGGTVRALDTTSREVNWTAKVAAPATSAVLAGPALLVTAGDGLHALDPATGTTLWTAVGLPVAAPPAVTARGIYVGARDGVLYALR